MQIRSKTAVILLAVVLGSPLVFAQMPSGPGQSGQQDGHAPHHPMWQGQGGPAGNRGPWGGDGNGRGNGRRMMGMHGRRGGQQGMMLARLLDNPAFREKLGITADQAAKIRQQTTDFQEAGIRNRADLQIKHLELQSLLKADNPDRAAIDRKLTEISATQLAQQKAMIGFHLSMRSALTAEQKQKLQQMREGFMHRGPGGPGGPGHDGGKDGPQGQRGGMRHGPQQGTQPSPPSPQDQN